MNKKKLKERDSQRSSWSSQYVTAGEANDKKSEFTRIN